MKTSSSRKQPFTEPTATEPASIIQDAPRSESACDSLSSASAPTSHHGTAAAVTTWTALSCTFDSTVMLKMLRFHSGLKRKTGRSQGFK